MSKHTVRSLVLLTLIAIFVLPVVWHNPARAQKNTNPPPATATPTALPTETPTEAPTATPTPASSVVIDDILPASGEMIETSITIYGDNLLYGKPVVTLDTPEDETQYLPLTGAGIMPPDSATFPGKQFLVVAVDSAYDWPVGTYNLTVSHAQGSAIFSFEMEPCSGEEHPDCKRGRSRRQ